MSNHFKMWLFYEDQIFHNYHDPCAHTKYNTEIHPIVFTVYEKMVKFIEWEYATKCESIYAPYIGSKQITIPSKEELSGKSKIKTKKYTVYEINYEQVYKGIIMCLANDTDV